eukprot:gene10728-22413_t
MEIVKDIKDSCVTSRDIFNDLLDYEKLEAGIMELDRTLIPAIDFITSAIQPFHMQKFNSCRTMSKGADRALLKPVDIHLLEETIREPDHASWLRYHQNNKLEDKFHGGIYTALNNNSLVAWYFRNADTLPDNRDVLRIGGWNGTFENSRRKSGVNMKKCWHDGNRKRGITLKTSMCSVWQTVHNSLLSVNDLTFSFARQLSKINLNDLRHLSIPSETSGATGGTPDCYPLGFQNYAEIDENMDHYIL